jgi:hypothetical protein
MLGATGDGEGVAAGLGDGVADRLGTGDGVVDGSIDGVGVAVGVIVGLLDGMPPPARRIGATGASLLAAQPPSSPATTIAETASRSELLFIDKNPQDAPRH